MNPQNTQDFEKIELAIKSAISYLEERGIRERGTVGRTKVLPDLDVALTLLVKYRATNHDSALVKVLKEWCLPDPWAKCLCSEEIKKILSDFEKEAVK